MIKRLSFLSSLLIYLSLLAFGCASKPVLKNSEPLPPIVKEWKTVTVHGQIPGMQSTGVYLEKGDFYSLFGNGEINVWPTNPNKSRYLLTPGKGTLGREGNNYAFALSEVDFSGYLRKAYYPGNLHLGIIDGEYDSSGTAKNPSYFKHNLGSFKVDIIVWQRDDPVEIADFYGSLVKQNPDNKQIQTAFNFATQRKKLYLAEKKTSEEMVKVEQEIKALKKKSEQPHKAPSEDSQEEKTLTADQSQELTALEQEKVSNLEDKLEQLNATLTQLEEMKQKFEAERSRSDLLAKELEEQKNKEQKLRTRLESSSVSPPVIVVATPQDGTNTEAAFISLSGVVVDEQGLEQVQFFINDQALEGWDQRGLKPVKGERPKRQDFNEKISLDKGTNRIKISAISSDGLVTDRILTIHRIETRRNIWAVVIGINTYPNIRRLKYAVNDAKAFHRHLVEFTRIPPENAILLLNEDSTLKRIRSTLGTFLKNKAGKDDMVIIYFAGHGATERELTSPDGDGLEKYLLPYDVEPNDLFATALPMGEISRIFTRIQSERLIFIADACYSGASGGRTISFGGVRANISEGFLDRVASGKGKIILTASGANEVSEEKEDLGHGVFTYYLLEGLRGSADTDKDGLITVDEIYRYVSYRVPAMTNNEQHPVKKGSVEGQLVLGLVE